MGRKPLHGREELSSFLSSIVSLKWLSVYRSLRKAETTEPHGDSSVDRRLNVLNNHLVRYFSRLASLKEAETTNFLSQVFLALIYRGEDQDLFENARQANFKKLKDSMTAIFHQFHIDDDQSINSLSSFVEKAKKSTSKKVPESWEDIQTLVGLSPIHKVVDDWNATILRQSEILRPQKDFLDTINSMLKGKHLEINQNNELEVVLDNERQKRLSLADLSSGEKQLLIILGEALQQDRAEYIYIADEPELSLHVSWQECLTENIRKINPRVQVIFATHSPDIVGKFGNRVIEMGIA